MSIFLCQGAPGRARHLDLDLRAGRRLLYEEYQRRGAIIRQAPTNFPWGVREMNVEDLDGHRLRMGSEATGPAEAAGHDDGT